VGINSGEVRSINKLKIESAAGLAALAEAIRSVPAQILASSHDEKIRIVLLEAFNKMVKSRGFIKGGNKKSFEVTPNHRSTLFKMFFVQYFVTLNKYNLLTESVIQYLDEDLCFSVDCIKVLRQTGALQTEFLNEFELRRKAQGGNPPKFKEGYVPFKLLEVDVPPENESPIVNSEVR
jgi:hypothetical protein